MAPSATNGTNGAHDTNGSNGVNDTNGSNDVHETNGSNDVNGSAKPGGLNVVIIGAGIGGLTAAIFLRLQGHRVTVLEQSRLVNEVGAAMHLAPNSYGLLRRIGVDPSKIGANLMEKVSEYERDGTPIRHVDLEESSKLWQHPWLLIHRVHLHEELKRLAVSVDGEGTPVELRPACRVQDIDLSSTTAILESGERVQGDVLIGADGVHSRARASLPGIGVKARPSGKSAFRFLVQRRAALEDPVTAPFSKENGELAIWFDKDRRVVMYPCDSNQLLNFVCIHPREETVGSGEVQGWNTETDRTKLHEVYKNFGSPVLALLDKAKDQSLKAWELLDMDVLPTWVEGRLALLGDAAHPFLPHQGQGGACAIEDAAALTVVLQRGVTIEDVPERLRLYQEIRKERADKLQEYSRIAGQDLNGKASFDMMEFQQYNFGHDEWDNSTNLFRRWQWARNPNLYWRMPVSFGPFPGPRQTVEGRPRVATHSTFTTASVKFKTSRTLLQNLFPSVSFHFKSPGTVAYASFSQTTLNKMEWLGGSGYRHLGLYIHGVQYITKSGEMLDGTYLPLLFENLTDPIVSGREELGMPKLYCTIDLWRRATSYRIQAGWQGVSFGSIALEGLREVDAGASKGTIGGEDDQGIFAYKYIPRVGERGKADVEHATFVSHAGEAKVVPSKVIRVFEAATASIQFQALDWEALPTLHHVVSRLAEIPVYEVVSAKVVEGEGVPDVSSARRID